MSATITLLITKLGIPVAKALAGLWIENKVGAAVTGGIIDIVGGQWADRVGRQRLESQFQKIGDDLSKRIAPCLTGMPDGAVERLAEHLSLLVREQMEDVKTLVQGGVAIDKVAARFAEKDKRWQTLREQGQFDATAQDGYDNALKIIAEALLGYLGKLPDWQPAVELQQLQQLDSILDLLLAERSARQQGLDEYEKCYREALARSCDETALFGLPPGKFDATVKHMPLTETFVTLSMRDDGDGGGGAAPYMLDMLDRGGPLRVVIAGDAGSGKTTLVRWITMAAAAGRVSADIAKGADTLIETATARAHIDWGLRIPFLIRLREVKEGHLPKQSEWSALKVGGLPDQPSNWVHSITSTGRALIILDGLDEVDARRRRSILKDVWDSYLKDKPNACIITSRFAALSGLDRELNSFRRLHLDPLSPEDRTRLIELWYEAASRRVGPNRLPAPNVRARELRLEIDRKPVLRQLTTNPLLCAMVCALHQGRGTSLPATAAGLCADMVEMLLHYRDADQGMKVNVDYDAIAVDIRRTLVTEIADSMVSNGESDMEFADACRLVANKLPQYTLPQELAGDAERVLIALCERSGVIRRPQVDKVDFTHNKLKEYLAACAAATDVREQAVAARLPDAAWDEVAQFMMNLPNQPRTASRLLEAILTRWDSVPQRTIRRGPIAVKKRISRSEPTPDDGERDLRRDLGYLALCCATVATQLDPNLRRRAVGLRPHLIPPTNQWEAEKLAAMDDPPLDDLHYQANWSEATAAATALCLRLIGSDEASAQLSGFANDDRRAVALEVIQVLDPAHCPGFWRWLINRTDNEVYRQLPAMVSGRIRSLAALPINICREKLDLSGLLHLSDLHPLDQLTKIKLLSLRNTAASDVSVLKGLQNLQHLDLGNTTVSDVTPLKGLPNLRSVYLNNTAVSDVSALNGLKNLQVLVLMNTTVSDISGLKALKNLQILILVSTSVNDISALEALENLQHLDLSNTAISDVSALKALKNLRYLDLSSTEVRDVSALKALKNLRHLDLGNTEVSNVSALKALKNLQHLNLSNTAASDVSVLRENKIIKIIGPKQDIAHIKSPGP